MGSGIAQIAALSGCKVTLVDVDEDRAKAGFAAINGRLVRQAERRHLTWPELAGALANIQTAADWADLGTRREAAAVFEGTVEDIEAKLAVTRRAGRGGKR